jgi:hypothetical protein
VNDFDRVLRVHLGYPVSEREQASLVPADDGDIGVGRGGTAHARPAVESAGERINAALRNELARRRGRIAMDEL